MRVIRYSSLVTRVLFVAPMALIPLVAGCPGGAPADTDPFDEVALAQQLLQRITQTEPFEQWGRFPDAPGIIDSNLPHGPTSRVFISSEVEAALLADFTGQLPSGSIIVKENIGDDPAVTEAKLTVMWKVEGFDPDNNDWFWANLTPEGVFAAQGRIAACSACHGGVRSNDFLFVHQLQ